MANGMMLGWKRECADADELLRLMFPDQEPGDFRTDGGWINLPKVRELWARNAGVAPSDGSHPSDRERHLAEQAVIGNAWRLAALRVGANKFQQMPPVGYYDWSPQEWCDWVMAQPAAGVKGTFADKTGTFADTAGTFADPAVLDAAGVMASDKGGPLREGWQLTIGPGHAGSAATRT